MANGVTTSQMQEMEKLCIPVKQVKMETDVDKTENISQVSSNFETNSPSKVLDTKLQTEEPHKTTSSKEFEKVEIDNQSAQVPLETTESINSSHISRLSDVPSSEVPSLVGIESISNSTSASSTPRDESSSGSPSPIPDEAIGKQALNKSSIKLGKDLSLMMQALNTLQSPEEKIAALCKKYADLLDQQKLLQKQLRMSQRKQAQVLKEKEQVQAEHVKSLSARSKLESLCRELQRRNRAMKEEQQQKSLEEVNLRQEMAADFQTTLDRIQNQMKTAVDGSNKLQSENERIGGKLNEIVEKYQEREKAMENIVKQHNLQEQLVTAQLEKALLEHEEEKERNAEEKQILLQQLIDKTAMYEEKVKQEKELREQLQYYSEKFEDFQSTLEKSNEVFTSFRTEMDKMSKKLKQTEKYRAAIQKKWEDSTKALADTVDYTQQLEAKQARLEKLSRALQAERNDLAQRLRQYEGDDKKSKESSKKKKVLEEKTNKEPVKEHNETSPDVAVSAKSDVEREKDATRSAQSLSAGSDSKRLKQENREVSIKQESDIDREFVDKKANSCDHKCDKIAAESAVSSDVENAPKLLSVA